MLEEFDSLQDDNASEQQQQQQQRRPVSVDLSSDLQVEISDAVSERERVKFTIRTVTSLVPHFARPEFTVVRSHEEFAWLAERLSENDAYAGLVVPPAPPEPDFAASRDKLARLGDGENSLPKEEYDKMKAELEAEYLATFKKTVAMHEMFLRRIAQHPRLREDEIFKVFLEYDNDLNARQKTRRETMQGLLRSGWKTVDDAYLSAQTEKDPFFKQQRRFILSYFVQLRLCWLNADKVAKAMKATADSYISIGACCEEAAHTERSSELSSYLRRVSQFADRYRKLEGRAASDKDLKLSDTLHYYVTDCGSARDLLYRRARALADFESSNKELEKARAKAKAVEKAEKSQEAAYERFNDISESARCELGDFKQRWVGHLHRCLTGHTEMQIKHAAAQVQLLRDTLRQLRQV